jgi:hypothetical protein
MNFSATNAAPDFSWGRKPFIALEEKMVRRRRFCNQAEGEPLIILSELITRQVEPGNRCFATVAKKEALRAVSIEPVGLGRLMNKDNFVAYARRLKVLFAYEGKKPDASGDHFSCSEGKPRAALAKRKRAKVSTRSCGNFT